MTDEIYFKPSEQPDEPDDSTEEREPVLRTTRATVNTSVDTRTELDGFRDAMNGNVPENVGTFTLRESAWGRGVLKFRNREVPEELIEQIEYGAQYGVRRSFQKTGRLPQFVVNQVNEQL